MNVEWPWPWIEWMNAENARMLGSWLRNGRVSLKGSLLNDWMNECWMTLAMNDGKNARMLRSWLRNGRVSLKDSLLKNWMNAIVAGSLSCLWRLRGFCSISGPVLALHLRYMPASQAPLPNAIVAGLLFCPWRLRGFCSISGPALALYLRSVSHACVTGSVVQLSKFHCQSVPRSSQLFLLSLLSLSSHRLLIRGLGR